MKGKGFPGIQNPWVLPLVICLVAILAHAGACAKSPEDETRTVSPHETAHTLLRQDALLAQAPGDGDLWACPWCGKRDNPFWAVRCAGCGYLVCNPGGYLLRPVDTDLVTNGYSSSHRGVDFGAAEGSPVFSAGDGVVIEAGRDRWAGNVLRIAHEGGIETRYGHLREIGVQPGRFVRMGQAVAWSGSTGAVTGPHLHFEVIVRGEEVDPLPYLAP